VTASRSPDDAPGAIDYRLSPPLADEALNALFAAAWPNHAATAFAPVLARSLAWVAAFEGGELVGFVNVAWDGGAHAFVLDTTVHPRCQRCGVGPALVRRAAEAASAGGAQWLHVD
jgi:ribosomal protein S18 acetylase RimI-like enzyme